jgi:hypothetical protein
MENRDWLVLICEIAIGLITAILLIVAIDQIFNP